MSKFDIVDAHLMNNEYRLTNDECSIILNYNDCGVQKAGLPFKRSKLVRFKKKNNTINT